MKRGRSFATRLSLALGLLLLVYGVWVAGLGRQVAEEQEHETLQSMSHGLARHIVEHWPQITKPDADSAERAAREALLSMLMVVNPGVQVYVLDSQGRVSAYIGEPGMVRQEQVDLDPVRRFLEGAPLPLRGTDPMGGVARIFSAAMFAPRAGDTRPPGYLYVVLEGAAHDQIANQLSKRRVWAGAAQGATLGLLLTLALGLFVFRRLTLPLGRLAERLRAYPQHGADAAPAMTQAARARARGDEVLILGEAFDHMTRRIQAQAEHERVQAAAHRETLAGVAHDLRTPITALHGHLEAMTRHTDAAAPSRRLLEAALAQSNRVRRLSQQLFELAALQSSAQLPHRGRFRLDELLTDTVQKFRAGEDAPGVALEGPPPGQLELDGDVQLVERALTNLIDNALRHSRGCGPVRVSVSRQAGQAQILVEDSGPGLPAELRRRLEQGHPLRDPPLERGSGGIGGLGLAIAQRVAVLHGGSLRPMAGIGTRLCLALPLPN